LAPARRRRGERLLLPRVPRCTLPSGACRSPPVRGAPRRREGAGRPRGRPLLRAGLPSLDGKGVPGWGQRTAASAYQPLHGRPAGGWRRAAVGGGTRQCTRVRSGRVSCVIIDMMSKREAGRRSSSTPTLTAFVLQAIVSRWRPLRLGCHRGGWWRRHRRRLPRRGVGGAACGGGEGRGRAGSLACGVFSFASPVSPIDLGLSSMLCASKRFLDSIFT